MCTLVVPRPFRSGFKLVSLLLYIGILLLLAPVSRCHVLNIKLRKNRGASVWKSLRSNSLKLKNAASQKKGDPIDISNFMDVQVSITVECFVDGIEISCDRGFIVYTSLVRKQVNSLSSN